MKTKAIGVFDSGIGGLTVVSEIIKELPTENIIYFGDTARVPYGNKSTETIKRFSQQVVEFLLSQGVKLIVVACNTVSAVAIDWLKKKYPLPIVGVHDASVKKAIESGAGKCIGVIGTRATIESKMYPIKIHKINPLIKVYSKSCPLFVPIIEEGKNKKLLQIVIKNYLSPLKKRNIETLILGCTHYPLIKEEIQQFMGNNVKIIESSKAVIGELKKLVKKEHLLTEGKKKVKYLFYFSDIPREFKSLWKKFLPIKDIQYKRVIL